MRAGPSLIAAFRRAAAAGLAGAVLAASQGLTVSPPPREPDTTGAFLRFDSMNRAAELAMAAPGPYREDVARMQARLDSRFAAAPPHPFYDRAVIIDPGRVDAMAAMGPTTKEATEAFLASAGYPGLPEDALSRLNSRLQWHLSTPLGSRASTLSPSALSLSYERLCAIVPALPYAMADAAVPGLGLRESVEFYNRHEDWHCLDTFYDSRDLHERRIDWKHLKTVLEEPGTLHAISLAWRKETLADVGALGDMIREGALPAVIGPVSNWRRGRAAEDIQHCSTPALRSLERGIMDMGLDVFRRLGDQEAAQFYHAVVEGSGLSSAGAVRAFIVHAHGAAEEKAELEREAGTSPETARGVAMSAMAAQSRSLPGRHAAGEDRALAAPARELMEWDARGLILAKAFETSRRITPESMLAAYNALQGELRRDIEAGARDPLPVEKALKLRTAFLSAVDTTDFAAENRRRGAGITAAPVP